MSDDPISWQSSTPWEVPGSGTRSELTCCSLAYGRAASAPIFHLEKLLLLLQMWGIIIFSFLAEWV